MSLGFDDAVLQETEATIRLLDGLGREIRVIHDGRIPAGESKYFFFANELSAGFYLVEMTGEMGKEVQKVVVE